MYTYFFCDGAAVYTIVKKSAIPKQFLDWLTAATKTPWSCAYVATGLGKLPVDGKLAAGKTFADWCTLVSLWSKQSIQNLLTCDGQGGAVEDGSATYCILRVHSGGGGYRFMSAPQKWLQLLDSLGGVLPAAVAKVYEPHYFTDSALIGAFAAYYADSKFEELKMLTDLLDVIAPPVETLALPGVQKELAMLRGAGLTPVYLAADANPLRLNGAEAGLLTAAETSGLHTELRITQLLLLRKWLLSQSFTDGPPRTSDLTAAFSKHCGVALSEIGTHLKCIGFTNKRTAAGYVWPELCDRAIVTKKVIECATILRESDVFVGSAGLASFL